MRRKRRSRKRRFRGKRKKFYKVRRGGIRL